MTHKMLKSWLLVHYSSDDDETDYSVKLEFNYPNLDDEDE